MKLEKINENQIRCTLTREDLASRQIRLSELAYGSEKARSLFQDMMRQAYAKFGFNADNIPLMIEAIPVSEGSIMLNITKVEDPEELDTRFAKFAPFKNKTPDAGRIEDADDILNLIRKLYEAKQKAASPQEETPARPQKSPEGNAQQAVRRTPEAPRRTVKEETPSVGTVDFVRLYRFRTLDLVIEAASALRGVYKGSNTLYRTSGDLPYTLVIHKSAHTPEEFNKICNILGEYGSSGVCSGPKETFLSEHETVMIQEDALQKLLTLV